MSQESKLQVIRIMILAPQLEMGPNYCSLEVDPAALKDGLNAEEKNVVHSQFYDKTKALALF